jgi:hypothetical protein
MSPGRRRAVTACRSRAGGAVGRLPGTDVPRPSQRLGSGRALNFFDVPRFFHWPRVSRASVACRGRSVGCRPVQVLQDFLDEHPRPLRDVFGVTDEFLSSAGHGRDERLALLSQVAEPLQCLIAYRSGDLVTQEQRPSNR